MEEMVLTHHGIKGQRWGIRRFQNKNGGLTPAGRKRYSGDNTDTEKETKSEPVKKTLKDMSDDELTTAIRRAQLEQQYRAYYPEQLSAGKKFVDTTLNKVIAPAAISAGEQFLRKSLNNFGDKILKEQVPEDGIAKLRKTYEKLDLEKKIKDLKEPTESLDSLVKRLENERKLRELSDDNFQDLAWNAKVKKLEDQLSKYNTDDDEEDE